MLWHIQIRGQSTGVSSLFPPGGFIEIELRQAGMAASTLPAVPYDQPKKIFLKVQTQKATYEQILINRTLKFIDN